MWPKRGCRSAATHGAWIHSGSADVCHLVSSSPNLAFDLMRLTGCPLCPGHAAPRQLAMSSYANSPQQDRRKTILICTLLHGVFLVSRGIDDSRGELTERAPDRQLDTRSQTRIADVPTRGLRLPRGEVRERVEHRGREYSLNGAETRALATVGAFRVGCPSDVGHGSPGRHISPGDWRHLADQGLLTRESLTDRDGVRHVVALTREGKDLLDAHASTRADGHRQEYYAGVVKPRELRHDAQIYRLYQEEAAQIEREGGRVTRVVLDYELKRDYQHFLHRDDRHDDIDLRADRRAFAEAHDLTVVNDHLELPDLRIEYETETGRTEYRDVELVTEHYSRGQLAGKAHAGFSCYRASGGRTRRGGTPHDPHHLERL